MELNPNKNYFKTCNLRTDNLAETFQLALTFEKPKGLDQSIWRMSKRQTEKGQKSVYFLQ
jgi:hypothetical protein